MKVELTENIVAVMDECATRLDRTRSQGGITQEMVDYLCLDLCPLRGACMEFFSGDDSENN